MFIKEASAEKIHISGKTKPCFELMIDFVLYIRLHASRRLVDIPQGNCEFLVSVSAIFSVILVLVARFYKSILLVPHSSCLVYFGIV